MKRIYIPKKQDSVLSKETVLFGLSAFVFGVFIAATTTLNIKVHDLPPQRNHPFLPQPANLKCPTQSNATVREDERRDEEEIVPSSSSSSASSVGSALQGLNVLVVVVAFDFSQIPHLEEVLDSYQDLCAAGANVDLIIHSTVAYPVTLIDMYNSRITCERFSVTVVLKPSSLRLHLVDCHREVFYEKIDEYDLFIYTEDDIRVTPTAVATYMVETRRIETMLAGNAQHKPSDFNVGIVRYEYNYPANVVMDDNTRHATQNVTRVYWEHSGFDRPVVPNAVVPLKQEVSELQDRYVSMRNHHQGMFLATRDLLKAWKVRGPACDFATVRDRPGRGNQPSEGTQRVWMSSQMLYGGRHCNVQQILPKNKFGALTVLHLPNKNYRRVGKYRNRKFADGSEVFESPHASLLTAMELHLALRQEWPGQPQRPYLGIRMIDEVDKPRDRTSLLERRMKEYEDYVRRGGVLSDDDRTKTELVEDA
jgi:hypothetical protein